MNKFTLEGIKKPSNPQTTVELYPGMIFQTVQQEQETEIIWRWTKKGGKLVKQAMDQPGGINGIGALPDPPWAGIGQREGKEPALFLADCIYLFPGYSGLYTWQTELSWQIFL